MSRTAILWPAGIVTIADTFSREISVPVAMSVRAMTTSSAECRRMVSSTACSMVTSSRRKTGTDQFFLSVVVAWHEGAAFADEEVEVGALVRLQHVVEVQLPVATLERRGRWLPPCFSLR